MYDERVQLHCVDEGAREGRPLFFLHGLFGSVNNWAFAAASAARAGFRCIRVDLPNHGRSPRAPRMDYPSMAGDLLELADRMGMEEFSVVGHSMGGKAAMEAALASPGRIASLVVVDIGPGAYGPLYADTLRALRALDLGAVSSRADADRSLAAAIPDPALRSFLLTNLARGSEGAYRWRLGIEEIEADYGSIWAGLRGGRSFAGPSLFVRGANSRYIDEAQLRAIRSLFPAYRLTTIGDAGHWVPSDAPESFSDALLAFLGGR